MSLPESEIQKIIERYPPLREVLPALQSAYRLLAGVYQGGGKLLVCGNGGSAADSEHIIGELMKGFQLQRPIPAATRTRLESLFPQEGAYLADHLQGALPAISLTSQSSLISAFSNDVCAEMAYAQQVYGYGQAGDGLVALSTSGNSANILQAVRVAKALGLRTLGLTGERGGELRELCDVTICAPAGPTYAVQEYHLAIYHALCAALEVEFFAQ